MLRLMRCLVVTGAVVGPAGFASALQETAKGDSMHPRVKMETSLGDLILELDAEKAPISTLNFIKYAEDKFYDGTIFHRVMANFMIQGGGYTPDVDQKSEGIRPGIRNEWKNGLKNVKGTIAMARLGGQPDSATAQFFINVVDNAALDGARDGAAYAVFGKVVEGMDTVEKIRNTEVEASPKYPGGGPVVPKTPVVIKSVRLVGPFDRAKTEAAAKEVEDKAKAASAATDAEDKKASADRMGKILELVKKTETETGKKAVTVQEGLYSFDLKDGDGPAAGKSSKVEVHYTGWLTDGKEFDSSKKSGKPVTFTLGGGVIKGWSEGLAGMKIGGVRKLILASEFGYGKSGHPAGIPPNATLIFEVELVSIPQ